MLTNLLDSNEIVHQTVLTPHTNLKSLSCLSGSDFFYPASVDQHEYDNLISQRTFFSNSRHHQPHDYEPFPIIVDCPHCHHRTDNRSSLRDISCQVPSIDDDNNGGRFQQYYKHLSFERHLTHRSSPLYSSPRSSPIPCQPPMARTLLEPYHFRHESSLSSSIALHHRSKSVPSSSSNSSTRSTTSIDQNMACQLPSLVSLESTMIQPLLTPSYVTMASRTSTTTLLDSIKTSIHAMRKRLKDIRRLSEVGIFCHCC
jgi:hypothetical protein